MVVKSCEDRLELFCQGSAAGFSRAASKRASFDELQAGIEACVCDHNDELWTLNLQLVLRDMALAAYRNLLRSTRIAFQGTLEAHPE